MSKVPSDNTFVDSNSRIVPPWLSFLRNLEPASGLSAAQVTALKALIAADEEEEAAPPEVGETTVEGFNRQAFSEDGTWIKPSTGKVSLIRLWGAGGSGGARTGGNSNCAGGGGGAFTYIWIPYEDLPDTVLVTIGQGGAPVSPNTNGIDGGNTTFGSFLTAFGGGGGPMAGTANTTGGYGGGWTAGSTGIGATPGTTGTTHAANESSGAPGAGTINASSDEFVGGNAVNGGAGGGSVLTIAMAGGTSVTGGDGGASNPSGAGADGQAPGGGGGGAIGNPSGAGGDGYAEIYTF